MRKYPGYCLFFSLLVNHYLIAQQCNCPGTDQSIPSSNIICRAKTDEKLAINYIDQNKFDSAELYFQKAEEQYKQSGCSDSIFLSTYKYWAQLYYTKGDFGKSQEYCFKLLRSAEASGDVYEMGTCYTMIAQLFNQMGQAEKGIAYTRKAVSLLSKINSPSQSTDLLFKLSKRYLWHYQDTKTSSSLDSSEMFSQQQLIIAKKINKRYSIASAFGNLEGIAWERNEFSKALRYIDSSFSYTDTSDYGSMAVNYYDKADLLIELKNYSLAEKMADSAMYYYQRSQSVAYIAETYQLLSRIAVEKKDYKKAFETYQFASTINDSIKNVEKTKQVTELERKYHQANNEKTIHELAQQKRIYLLLAITGLLGLGILAFLIRQQSLKSKQRILETQQRLNRARMNPHFFFNALSSLQLFSLEGHDGRTMATNLSKFSHIMRETLESTYKEYVTIEQEISFLTGYLQLQQLRFPGKFAFDIITDERIEPAELMIPSMILQPFVENSIEHGFTANSYEGRLVIKFTISGKELVIEIIDNGRGMPAVAKENSEHISRATQIIRDRMFLLNTKLKTKAGFSIGNNKEGNGVLVSIILPLLYDMNKKK